MIFTIFWLTLISLFYPNYVKPFVVNSQQMHNENNDNNNYYYF